MQQVVLPALLTKNTVRGQHAAALAALTTAICTDDLPACPAYLQSWLRKLAVLAQSSYLVETGPRAQRHNHVYWAGLSVATAAIALNDATLFQWGINR